MAEFLVFFSFIVLVSILITRVAVRRHDADVVKKYSSWLEVENLPQELSYPHAQLIISEGTTVSGFRKSHKGTLYTEQPVGLEGIPDQAYRTKRDNLVILVDTKSRKNFHNRVFDSEKLQLSVYKVILKYGYQQKVADYAYVRLLDESGKAFYLKTKLFSTNEVVKRYARLRDLVSGKVKPCKAKNLRLCITCPFRVPCQADSQRADKLAS